MFPYYWGKAEVRRYWYSSRVMTVRVEVDNRGVITYAAPVVRRFIGQPCANLQRWMSKQGGFTMCDL
jgi:hypothetical protein